MRRASLAFVAAALIMGGGLVAAQRENSAGKKPHAKIIAAADIREEVDGKKSKATFIELTLEPGAAGSPHRHPGPVFGYVLEGDVEFAVDDEEVRKLKAGDTFYEPGMALHAVMRNPSDKTAARVMVVMLHPRDTKQLAIPEPATTD